MNLEKPIVWLDIESTGIDRENDRIIELCMIKVYPTQELPENVYAGKYPSFIEQKREVKTRRFNPEMPIPAGASEVHGIYDEDVKDEPTFRQLAKGIHSFIQGCDLGGFNSNSFDLPMLYSELLRSGIEWDYSAHRMIDVGNIYKRLYPRTLESAVKNFLGREHDGAHGAEPDTVATYEVMDYFLSNTGDELPSDINGLHLYSNYDKQMLDLHGKFTFSDDGKIILLNFGKHRGEPAAEHLDFLEWMVTRASFTPDVNKICYQILSENGL